MAKYRVWLEDVELQSAVVEARDSVDARRKTEQMLDDGTLWNDKNTQFTESCFEVRAIEPVR